MRRTVAALLALAAPVAGGVATAGETQSDAPAKPSVRIFKTTENGQPELLVYLSSELVESSGAARHGIRFVCFDRDGRALLRYRWAWPKSPVFDHLPPIPHFHQPVATKPALLALDRCRLTGTPVPVTAGVGRRILTGHPPALLVNPAARGLDA